MKWKDTILEVLAAVVPIVVLVSVLHFTVAGIPMETYIKFLIGSLMVIAGLFFFLIGVRVGIIPIGKLIGSAIISKGRLWMILFFAFVIGMVITLAEPDVQVLSTQVDLVSAGAIPRTLLLVVVAGGVGIFVLLSMIRVLFKIPLVWILTVSYIVAFILAIFTPERFLAVAFDAGGVTTGPLTVPFVLALGVGVASVLGDKSGTSKSFGLIALASVGPILAVLILGVIFG